MTHLDDDTLLKFHLEMLDPSDDVRIRQHLSACRQCGERDKKVQGEVGRLSEIEMRLDEVAPPPLPRRVRFFAVAARVAAVLAVGFLAGYMTAEVANPLPPNTVQQRLVPARLAAPPSGYVPCQAVDAGAGR